MFCKLMISLQMDTYDLLANQSYCSKEVVHDFIGW